MVNRSPRNKNGKGRSHRPNEKFVSIPFSIAKSDLYRSLSPISRCVLVELLLQYNGYNNGNLSAPRSILKEWCIGSPVTLDKALKELERKGFIVKTRQGVFAKAGATCSLYAVCWFPIHDCKGVELEIEPTGKMAYKSIYQIINGYKDG